MSYGLNNLLKLNWRILIQIKDTYMYNTYSVDPSNTVEAKWLPVDKLLAF